MSASNDSIEPADHCAADSIGSSADSNNGTVESTRTYQILADNRGRFTEHLIKINRRAVKLGLPLVVCEWGKAYTGQVDYVDQFGSVKQRSALIIPATITGPFSICYSGWQFVAAIQHLPEGNIVRSISQEPVPAQYRSAASDCDHCHINRRRNDTFIVKHSATGQIKQVGSTCIKDFLGTNVDNIIGQAQFAADLNGFLDSSEHEADGLGEPTYSIIEFLNTTAAVIRLNGWTSKSKAEETGHIPTVEFVKLALTAQSNKERVEITELDSKLAASAIEWLEQMADSECECSDYLYNIRLIVRAAYVERRTMGFAASIIAAYNKYLADKLAKEQTANSAHVGQIKQRLTFILRVTNCFSYETVYGCSHKYIFSDMLGNVFTWAASSHQDLEIGHVYTVLGTIKDHSEYKGTKQTVLSRCAIKGEIK